MGEGGKSWGRDGRWCDRPGEEFGEGVLFRAPTGEVFREQPLGLVPACIALSWFGVFTCAARMALAGGKVEFGVCILCTVSGVPGVRRYGGVVALVGESRAGGGVVCRPSELGTFGGWLWLPLVGVLKPLDGAIRDLSGVFLLPGDGRR